MLCFDFANSCEGDGANNFERAMRGKIGMVRAGADRAGGALALSTVTGLSMPSVIIVVISQEAFVVLRLTKLSGRLCSGRNFAAPLAANLQRVRQADRQERPSGERGSTEADLQEQ